jgi:hypothetical protein
MCNGLRHGIGPCACCGSYDPHERVQGGWPLGPRIPRARSGIDVAFPWFDHAS